MVYISGSNAGPTAGINRPRRFIISLLTLAVHSTFYGKGAERTSRAVGEIIQLRLAKQIQALLTGLPSHNRLPLLSSDEPTRILRSPEQSKSGHGHFKDNILLEEALSSLTGRSLHLTKKVSKYLVLEYSNSMESNETRYGGAALGTAAPQQGRVQSPRFARSNCVCEGSPRVVRLQSRSMNAEPLGNLKLVVLSLCMALRITGDLSKVRLHWCPMTTAIRSCTPTSPSAEPAAEKMDGRMKEDKAFNNKNFWDEVLVIQSVMLVRCNDGDQHSYTCV